MTDQPHYPYADGDRAVLGPEVTATADGMTITWRGATYRRDHGEHVGAATPLICSDERHAAKVAALQADLDRYEEVLGDLNETLVDRAKQAARAEAERDQIREDLGAALGRADADRASLTEVRMRERARQAAIERVRSLAADMRESADTRWFADQLTGALDDTPAAPATTRYIHATITNRDEYTANRAALSLVDWIHAEFPGLQVTTDAREWPAPAARDQTPWCCTGPGYVAECPLCPEYGTSLLDPCPGHELTEDNQRTVDTARLHAERRHPGYEYATTTGPRKQWDNPDEPPSDEHGDPDPSWEPNVDAGRPGQGWDRFDYHEEAYWRRRKPLPEQLADQPEPAPAATQATEPREHCGDLKPQFTENTERTECILRPGHTGSHADHHGTRWWWTDEAIDARPAAADPATVTDPEWLRQQYAQAIRRWWDADDGGAEEIADAVMRVRDGYVDLLRQRLELADQAHRQEQQRADRLAALAREILYATHNISGQDWARWRETLDNLTGQP